MLPVGREAWVRRGFSRSPVVTQETCQPMDGARFDRISKVIATSTRRTLARGLAVLPLAVAGDLLGEDAEARR